ncbi:hypothetical protein D9619_008463 [Psilocybe cf. subviscida]|uniref:Uncharacterized protein n=1 Tax=Psilocybe cf. subviscida TaxID=2480587 RepID=A0A8H5BAU4_9AGAR|nr:hypothetical protein D9619_008463 [Psilocybe cf. subviscida]
MDTSFTFPRQQAAAARPRPPKSAVEPGSSARESNVLRASVLDAALELGLGTNPIVAGWMFNNALPEEDEEEQNYCSDFMQSRLLDWAMCRFDDARDMKTSQSLESWNGQNGRCVFFLFVVDDTVASPGLTYTTSEESSNSALSPSSSAYSSGSSSKFPPYSAGARAFNDKLFEKEPSITIVEPSPMNLNFEQSISGKGIPGGGITFPDMPPPPRPTTPSNGGKKLKKKKKDGYESDGGYMSESGKKKEKAKKKGADLAADPDASTFVETEKEAKKRAKEEKKEQELERKRTKSLMSAAKAAKKAEKKEAGYDTDGGGVKQSKSSKKSKSGAAPSAFTGDASLGYETDGYQSATPKKSKTRFFKLSTKSSKADLRAGAPSVPPLPSGPPKPTTEFIPLPIAERFATTFGPLTLSGLSEDTIGSSSVPPLPSAIITSPSIATTPSSAMPPPLLKSSLAFPSVNTRDSQVSTASSSSNGSRSQQLFNPLSASASLSPRHGTVESVGTSVGSGSAHHGHGSGSYSTITSSSHQQQQSNISTDITASTSNESATHPSNHSAKSGSIESNLGSLRPPALSFPAVRAPSPSRRPPPVPPPTTSPPIAPLKLLRNLRSKASLDNLHLPSMSRTRSPSPMPVTPVSPGTPDTPDALFVIAPANSNASSPTLGATSPMQTMYLQAPSASQGGSPISPISPRSPARSFMGDRSTSPVPPATREALAPPPRTVISSPNTAILPHSRPTNLSINPNITVKSSSLSPGPNPNVLAYYDLPPPSPPPPGPLPSVPSQPPSSPLAPSSSTNILPSPAALRQRVIDRTPRQLPPEFSAVFNGQTNIERGRQSPFPARPVPAIVAPTGGAEPGTVAPLRRYRDLYSPTSANTLMPPMAQPEMGSAQSMPQVKRARFRSKNSWIENDYTRGGSSDYGEEEEEYLEDEEDEDCVDLANVLERYEDRNAKQVEALPPAQAEERSLSIAMDDEQDDHANSDEAYVVRPRPPRVRDEKNSLEVDDRYRNSEYQFDDGRTIGDRTSRWSGSIYSRASIMDEDSSGQTRDRLVRRVEAMLRDGGGGNKGFVPPPVPRLPDAYSSSGSGVNANALNRSGTPGRSWNRF